MILSVLLALHLLGARGLQSKPVAGPCLSLMEDFNSHLMSDLGDTKLKQSICIEGLATVKYPSLQLAHWKICSSVLSYYDDLVKRGCFPKVRIVSVQESRKAVEAVIVIYEILEKYTDLPEQPKHLEPAPVHISPAPAYEQAQLVPVDDVSKTVTSLEKIKPMSGEYHPPPYTGTNGGTKESFEQYMDRAARAFRNFYPGSPMGFVNVEGTCWLNSAMQLLLSLYEDKDAILASITYANHQRFKEELASVFRARTNGETMYDLTKLRDTLGEYFRTCHGADPRAAWKHFMEHIPYIDEKLRSVNLETGRTNWVDLPGIDGLKSDVSLSTILEGYRTRQLFETDDNKMPEFILIDTYVHYGETGDLKYVEFSEWTQRVTGREILELSHNGSRVVYKLMSVLEIQPGHGVVWVRDKVNDQWYCVSDQLVETAGVPKVSSFDVTGTCSPKIKPINEYSRLTLYRRVKS